MSQAFYHQYLENENLLLSKVVGAYTSRDLFFAFRDVHIEIEATLNCSSIFDMRLWVGLIYDEDFFDYLIWTAERRESLGLLPYLRNNLVVILPKNNAPISFVEKLATARGRPIHSAWSVSEAWAALFGPKPMIKPVLAFFEPRSTGLERISRLFGRD